MVVNILILALVLSINFYSIAQTKNFNANQTDSIKFDVNSLLKKKSAKVFVLNIGSLNYNVSSEGEGKIINQMELNSKNSKSFGFDIMIRGLRFFKKKMYLMPGIGIEKNNYHFKNKNISLATGKEEVVFSHNRLITFYKYKLNTTYIHAPLLLGLQTGTIKKPVNVQLGIVGGINIATLTKEKYSINQTKFKNKIIDDYHINRYKLEGIARVYFGKIGLFGKYAFTSLFQKGKAPKTIPFTLGISLASI